MQLSQKLFQILIYIESKYDYEIIERKSSNETLEDLLKRGIVNLNVADESFN